MPEFIDDKIETRLVAFWNWVKSEQKVKIVLGGIILFHILYLIFFTPDKAKYNEVVSREIELAKRMCINSRDWALENEDNLRPMDKSLKGKIKVDGKDVELKYVEYPYAERVYTGKPHPRGLNDIYSARSTLLEYYCIFRDPRGRAENISGNYYYDYNKGIWVDNVGFHH